MAWRYNLVAGQSVGRFAALGDGFAVAMTLLVLDLKVPASPPALFRSGR
jgi:uncharacterized membrane protein